VSFIWDMNESQWQSAGESIPARLSENDKETIRLAMYQSFRDAFLGFAVRVTITRLVISLNRRTRSATKQSSVTTTMATAVCKPSCAPTRRGSLSGRQILMCATAIQEFQYRVGRFAGPSE